MKFSRLGTVWSRQLGRGWDPTDCGRDILHFKHWATHAGMHQPRGMSMVELLIVVAMLGIIAAVSVPMYKDYRHRAMVAQTVSDIVDIDVLIAQFQADNNGNLPDNLADIGRGGLLDPWGNPYDYLNLTTGPNPGEVRKNKNLVPINSDYDLYSSGEDGDSKGALTAQASRDDIIRANNGRFVGLASDYE
ncbi:MAG: prepilin-type N-terminal cleavage/methylation domain-containing protein [Betaproteobacteria bacterium]|nr:MAG: prepilin-type N-terminal cleavage/methylation domain-containing protein [Betaproteobacteria bacterium]